MNSICKYFSILKQVAACIEKSPKKLPIDLSMKKETTLRVGHFTTISGHFFANCMFIFHKTEVQMVILRCLTGLHLDWFRHYGLRCRWRPCMCLANSQKIATDKWPFYDHFWPFLANCMAIFHKTEI